MKTNKHTIKIRIDKEKKIYAVEDSINFILSLVVIVLSVVAIGIADTAVFVHRIIIGAMALIAFINVFRFYREKPKISALCLFMAAVFATLAVLI